MKNFLCILSLTLWLSSCEDPRQQEVGELQTQCVAIHDEIMPWMDSIEALEVKLKRWHGEIESDTLAESVALKSKLSMTITKLDEADEAMMDWMVNYNPKYALENPVDSALVYFKTQKSEIEEIRELMKVSIDEAKALLVDY